MSVVVEFRRTQTRLRLGYRRFGVIFFHKGSKTSFRKVGRFFLDQRFIFCRIFAVAIRAFFASLLNDLTSITMKRKVFFLFCILFTGILTGCTSQTNDDDDSYKPFVPGENSGAIQLRAALLPRVAQDNAFALNIFRTMTANTGDDNVIVSPLSISLAFGMAWNGADGTTKAEMGEVFGYAGMADSLVNEYYEVMQKSMPVLDSSTVVSIANSIWYAEEFTIKQSFLQTNQQFFNAEVRKLDFQLPTAKDTINAWVDAKTNHLIPTIVNETRDMVMFLINAVYFKGAWALPFNPTQTYQRTFTKENGGTATVNMMSMLDTLRYGTDEHAQYLDMNYGNGAYSMVVVLPKTGKTISDVLTSMTAASFDNTVNSLIAQRVQVNFPRFKASCLFDLVETLKSLGLNQAFTEMADFSGISDTGLMISEVKHKTYIEVTEEGTKAAAVTSIGFTTSLQPAYPTFVADKPFLFFIREKGTGIILFAGKMGSVEPF
jgi:serine protease inhibitor